MPNEKAFFTKGTPSDTSRSHSSSTVEHKKERAEKLAPHKRQGRCYQCGKRGHFGIDRPNNIDSSTDIDSSKRKQTTRSSRRH